MDERLIHVSRYPPYSVWQWEWESFPVDCSPAPGGYAAQVLLELFYGPLLFIFVLWNIAGYIDRRSARTLELTGGKVEFVHRARAEHLYTDVLAWGPFLIVQLICGASIGGILVGVSLLVGWSSNPRSMAVFMLLVGGIPISGFVYLLAGFADCRLAALWATASAPAPPAVPAQPPAVPAQPPPAGPGGVQHFVYVAPPV